MSNNTKIKFLNVADKIYQVTDISFFHMTIEATETNLTAADVPEYELWDISEFERYKVRLINNDGMGEIVDFGEFKKR
ncbi:hypothetical protein FMM74_020125 [Lachnospiraceae bacterium MD308]|nr:hypothetical protein [Lachnospiraceae bacterium MD308]